MEIRVPVCIVDRTKAQTAIKKEYNQNELFLDFAAKTVLTINFILQVLVNNI